MRSANKQEATSAHISQPPAKIGEIRLAVRIPSKGKRCNITGLSRSEIHALITGPEPKVASTSICGVNSQTTAPMRRGNRVVWVEPLLEYVLERGDHSGGAEELLNGYLDALRSSVGKSPAHILPREHSPGNVDPHSIGCQLHAGPPSTSLSDPTAFEFGLDPTPSENETLSSTNVGKCETPEAIPLKSAGPQEFMVDNRTGKPRPSRFKPHVTIEELDPSYQEEPDEYSCADY